MGYKTATSIKKWHIRNFLDSFKGRGGDFRVNYLTSGAGKDYKTCLSFYKVLCRLNLGRIVKSRYIQDEAWKTNHYFESSPRGIEQWYLKFNDLPKVIKL